MRKDHACYSRQRSKRKYPPQRRSGEAPASPGTRSPSPHPRVPAAPPSCARASVSFPVMHRGCRSRNATLPDATVCTATTTIAAARRAVRTERWRRRRHGRKPIAASAAAVAPAIKRRVHQGQARSRRLARLKRRGALDGKTSSLAFCGRASAFLSPFFRSTELSTGVVGIQIRSA
jgi:hypothetical protein